MGQVSSRLEDLPQIYLRDASRFALQSIQITDGQGNDILSVTVKEPGNKVIASSEGKRPIEFIQDPDRITSENLELLLKVKRMDELTLHFKGQVMGGNTSNGQPEVKPVSGLTFIHTTTLKDAKRLLTTDFNADPNVPDPSNPEIADMCQKLQRHKNVTYVGDYQTGSLLEWSWTWRPIADVQSNGPVGHRSFCCFVEYSQRENNFIMLASLSFWVEDLSFSIFQIPPKRHPGKISLPPESFDARLKSVPESPEIIISGGNGDIPRDYPGSPPPQQQQQVEPIQVSNPRADELLVTEVEDGPLFRSRIIALEKKTSSLKAKTKKIISRAETLLDSQNAYFEADRRWYDSLHQLASTNSKAVQPLLTNYLDASFIQNQKFHRKKIAHLQILINELRRIYDVDIKAAETKKRAFEEESQDYYHSMTKYLAKTDFPNTNKQKEKDSKYQSRRKDYELKRFDYWSYMNDLNGGRKEQEILHHLTQYMDIQLNTLMESTRAEKDLKPGLDALLQQVEEASREFKLMRTEREQRRRDLEMGKNIAGEGWQLETGSNNPPAFSEGPFQSIENVLSDPALTPSATGSSVSRGQWLSDVEDEEKLDQGIRKKEGILFALSRPANHNDPKVMPKLNWHKYWVVLDKGQLWEYTNWKRSSELHNDSIHLNAATVREAQNSERRFCFELVTPKFKRVYQATSNEDMESWIQAIRNAIESALDGSGTTVDLLSSKSPPQNIKRHPIGDMFSKSGKDRRTVSGSQETRELLTGGNDKATSKAKSTPSILTTLRNVDPSNLQCADCGSTTKAEWCSINLAVIICIECSGIHRSLGSHISKMRSLTLDTTSLNSNLVNLLRLLPNAISNSVWERVPNQSLPKPTAQSSYEARHAYITAKYVNKAFLEPLPSSTTANELLIRSITHGDLKGVLWALASKADPNTRAPILPALIVALLQDDKMANVLSKTDSASSSGSVQQVSKFPFAELLLLNGAMPVDPKTLPVEANALSDAARRYLQDKLDRILQNSQSPPAQYSYPSKSSSGLGVSTGSTSPQSGGNTSIGGDLNRTMSKLQKRLSSSGKTFRKETSPPLDKES